MTRERATAAWLTIAVVMGAAMTAQSFGRFTYGVVLPDVRDDLLDGSNSLAGTLGTVNVAAYLVGTIGVAAASARLRQVDLVRVGLCLSVSGLTVAAFAPNAGVLAVALLSMGLGGALIWIPSPRLGAQVLSPEKRGFAAGLVGSGIGMGIVIAGWLGSVLHEAYGEDSWRILYRIEAVVGAVVLVSSFVILRETGEATTGGSAGIGGFGALRTVAGWQALTASYIAYGFMYLMVVAFLVARLTDDAGWSDGRAAAMFSLFGLATVVGGLTIPGWSDRIGRRRTMTVGFLVYGSATLLILTGTLPLVILGAIGVGLMFAGVAGTIAAYVVDATDATSYGPAYAAATLAFGVAQVTSPQIGGALADATGSFTATFLVSVGFAAAGALAASRLPGR